MWLNRFNYLHLTKLDLLMKTTTYIPLPCAVLGHNFIRSHQYNDNSYELTCKCCGTVVQTDAHGNFDNISSPDKHIKSTLRTLYHLKLQLLKTKIAY